MPVILFPSIAKRVPHVIGKTSAWALAALMLAGGCFLSNPDIAANPSAPPAKYSAFKTAVVLFGEDRVVYLDFGYFTSKDIAAEVSHFLTLCSLIRGRSEKEELGRILQMVSINKRARMGKGVRFMTKDELDRKIESGVLTEQELKQVEDVLFNECAIPPLQFDYYPPR